jgi:hypothetical protein
MSLRSDSYGATVGGGPYGTTVGHMSLRSMQYYRRPPTVLQQAPYGTTVGPLWSYSRPRSLRYYSRPVLTAVGGEIWLVTYDPLDTKGIGPPRIRTGPPLYLRMGRMAPRPAPLPGHRVFGETV